MSKTWYKRYFDTRRRHAKEKVDPGDSVFVEATLADESQERAHIAIASFPVVAVNT